jgi:hypothetical protein
VTEEKAEAMQLTLVSDDGHLARVRWPGQFMQYRSPPGPHPFERLLGPDAFRRRVLFDLGATRFIDSSGVAWMLASHRRFREAGGRLVFHSPTLQVDLTLRTLCMDLALLLATDEAAALGLMTAE